ncbi:MAG: glycosyltransferase family 87 protein [Victivallaceae bacterium]|nr:glycosyltransferase family 87 protein [Victivallaceae bacterium]
MSDHRSTAENSTAGQRLWWILALTGGGMALAAIFHFLLCGRLLELPYPWNTFLFNPEVRFSDFTNHLNAAMSLAPYRPEAKETVFLPFAYGVFFLFGQLGRWAFPVFATLGSTGFIAFAAAVLPKHRWAALPMLLFCYPAWMAFDRGNIDLLNFAFLAFGIYAFDRDRPLTGALLLAFPIAVKLSPAVFLAVPLAKRRYGAAAIAAGVAVALNLAMLPMLRHSVPEALAGWRAQLAIFETNFIYGNSAFLYNCSMFGVFKAALRPFLSPGAIKTVYWFFAVGLGAALLAAAMRLKPPTTFATSTLAAAIFILCPNFSMDYRLLTLYVPILFWIRDGSGGKDVSFALLLATAVIPKNYWFFGNSWVGIGTAINPLVLLALATAVIVQCRTAPRAKFHAGGPNSIT